MLNLTVNSTVFWDVTPCRPVELSRRFGETYCPELQGQKYAKQAGQQGVSRNQNYLLDRCFGGTYCLHLQDRKLIQSSKKAAANRVTLFFVCLAYSSILNMKAVSFFGTLVKLYQITRHHIRKVVAV
jgi:hypothetical protein